MPTSLPTLTRSQVGPAKRREEEDGDEEDEDEVGVGSPLGVQAREQSE